MYLTDGTNLYEIASQRTVTNYGLRGGTISYIILRECRHGYQARMHELDLLAYEEVRV